MYGLEAISANNGWAMAITGPLIVMSGLTILAIIISQLHKVAAMFDKKESQGTETAAQKEGISAPVRVPDDISEAAKIYEPLIDTLEQPFELHTLYQAAAQHDFPHPILTVRRFKEAGVLVREGEGLFMWKR